MSAKWGRDWEYYYNDQGIYDFDPLEPYGATYVDQVGGVRCSLCKSEGTNMTTCPLNPNAVRTNPEKHPNAVKGATGTDSTGTTGTTSADKPAKTIKITKGTTESVPLKTIKILKIPRIEDPGLNETFALLEKYRASGSEDDLADVIAFINEKTPRESLTNLFLDNRFSEKDLEPLRSGMESGDWNLMDELAPYFWSQYVNNGKIGLDKIKSYLKYVRFDDFLSILSNMIYNKDLKLGERGSWDKPDLDKFAKLYIPFKLESDPQFVEKFLVNKHERHAGSKRFGKNAYPEAYDIVMSNLPSPWAPKDDVNILYRAIKKNSLKEVQKYFTDNPTKEFTQREISKILEALNSGVDYKIIDHIMWVLYNRGQIGLVFNAYTDIISKGEELGSGRRLGLWELVKYINIDNLNTLFDILLKMPDNHLDYNAIFTALVDYYYYKEKDEFHKTFKRWSDKALKLGKLKLYARLKTYLPSEKPSTGESAGKGSDYWRDFFSGKTGSSSSSSYRPPTSDKCQECFTKMRGTNPAIWTATDNVLNTERRAQVKKNFRKWAVSGGHPDKGGNAETFGIISSCVDDFEDYKC